MASYYEALNEQTDGDVNKIIDKLNNPKHPWLVQMKRLNSRSAFKPKNWKPNRKNDDLV